MAAAREFNLASIMAILLSASLLPALSAAFIPNDAADGWYTWRVPASENAPDWCCYTWNSGKAHKGNCDLDGKQINYSSHDDARFSPDQMQLYAFLEDGKPTSVRALSPRCAVESREDISDLGVIESEASIRWLEDYISPRSQISSHVLAAISVHGGPVSFEVLTGVIRDKSSLENRKDAIFWLVQSQSDQAMDYVERLLSGAK